MNVGDLIILLVTIVCLILGLKGKLKVPARLFSGCLVALLIVLVISTMVGNPMFDKLTLGVFGQSRVMSRVSQYMHACDSGETDTAGSLRVPSDKPDNARRIYEYIVAESISKRIAQLWPVRDRRAFCVSCRIILEKD